ncbi:MAG: DegT/DnrJ/EryC1/StrS family aminotransferase [Planctomycetota bacterium]
MPSQPSTPAHEPVPFLDLKVQYAAIAGEIRVALDEVLRNTAFVLGPAVQRFEADFAEFCGTKHCVALNSGTSALHVALLCLDIGPGDEVIVPAMSFIATAWPVLYVGARPVFVDVDPRRYTLDPARLAAAITKKTKAIMPVHLYGQCADMDPILEIAAGHNIPVIEDAAQAHGATYKNRRAGSLGRMACFSFYPGKNLGAYGEGGALVTSDDRLADIARQVRDHGQKTRYVHERLGFNYRMDGFQGAVLGVKLRHLHRWNAGRRQAAARYDELLTGSRAVTPPPCPDGDHVYHIYPVRCERRDEVQNILKESGIGTNLHYPIPIHLQKPFAACGHKAGDFPVSEELGRTELSLPMYAELTEPQIQRVAQAARAAVGG